MKNEVTSLKSDFAGMTNDVARLDAKVDVHRAETANAFGRVDKDFAQLDARVDLHRAETAKAFAGVDAKIDVLVVEVDAKLDAVRAAIAEGRR